MNHIFKVCWNVVSGQWVVTSELGKNNKKKNSVTKRVVIAGALLSVLGFNNAFSATTNVVFNESNEFEGDFVGFKGILTSVAGSDNKKYIIQNSTITTDTKVNGAEGQKGVFDFDISADYKASDFTVLLQDTTINNNHSKEGAAKGNENVSGIRITSLSDSNMNLILSGKNSITLAEKADTALLVNAGKSGDATVEVNGILNLTNKGNSATWDGTEGYQDGIETNVSRGTASILFDGEGFISVQNGNALYARVGDAMNEAKNDYDKTKRSTYGNINIIVNNSVKLTTDNSKQITGNGIYAEIYESLLATDKKEDNKDGNNILIESYADIDIKGISGVGIYAKNNNKTVAFNTIINHGSINVTNSENTSGHGIYSQIIGDGNTDLTNHGGITIVGSEASAIKVIGNGDINIVNTGNLTSSYIGTHIEDEDESSENTAGHGIDSQMAGEGITNLTNHGGITVLGPKANALNVIGNGNGDVNIVNTGNLTSSNIGINIENVSQDENASVNTSLESTGVVDASNGNYGILFNTSGKGQLTLGESSVIMGGEKAGIYLEGEIGSNTTLINNGIIGAASDRAIRVSFGEEAVIENNGTITGYITAGGVGAITFTNGKSGIFELRNSANNTKSVATSKFFYGSINNEGLIKFAETDIAEINDADVYIIEGVSNTSIAEKGIYQGHLSEVSEFSNSGVIDLRGASGKPGNILRISNSVGELLPAMVGRYSDEEMGASGKSVYIANGGTLYVTTEMNSGGELSNSDVLVLDSVKLGSKATDIHISAVGDGIGQTTTGNGILIVKARATDNPKPETEEEVLPFISGFSSDPVVEPSLTNLNQDGYIDIDAFKLANDTFNYGLYEYSLVGINDTMTEDGFYLQNGTELNTQLAGIQINPNIGQYLGMQYAAANMFNQNILDRRDNTRSMDKTVWGRMNYAETKTNHFDSSQSLKVKTSLIQLGWDLFQNEEKTSIFGLYAGYGHSDVKNRSHLTGSLAEGSIHGYQLGAYYSWKQQEVAGTYVDVWGHLAKYRNKLKGKTQNYSERSYNGSGYAISAEIGHGFVMHTRESNTQWILEPHAQLTYNYLNNKNIVDATNTRFSNNKSKGLDLRLGARFYAYQQDNNAIRPYVELNWLHSGTSNKVDVNTQKMSSKLGRNVGEIKVGMQGEVVKDMTISAHIGFQKGQEKFKRTEAQVVFNYNF